MTPQPSHPSLIHLFLFLRRQRTARALQVKNGKIQLTKSAKRPLKRRIQLSYDAKLLQHLHLYRLLNFIIGHPHPRNEKRNSQDQLHETLPRLHQWKVISSLAAVSHRQLLLCLNHSFWSHLPCVNLSQPRNHLETVIIMSLMSVKFRNISSKVFANFYNLNSTLRSVTH